MRIAHRSIRGSLTRPSAIILPTCLVSLVGAAPAKALTGAWQETDMVIARLISATDAVSDQG